MTRLILMRHAKSEWGDMDLSDHDRPPNNRGRRAAETLGGWLRSNGYLPDLALVSSAERTQETFALLKLKCPFQLERSLYLAPPAELWRAARDSGAANVLIIAHNPGIGELCAAVARPAPDHPDFYGYPTGATLVVDVADFDAGFGRLVDFTVPRDL